MKFWYSSYSLSEVQTKKTIEGALLKVKWPSGMIGYADLRPIKEYGDIPIGEQLEALKKFKLLPMVEQSIWLANRDAKSRDLGSNLMRGLPRVKNNFLIKNVSLVGDNLLGDLKRIGFSTLKIKCGMDLNSEFKFIDKVLRLGSFTVRLDFGSKLTAEEYKSFIESIPEALRPRIEYVEDPFRFSIESWKAMNAVVPLAADFEADQVPWDRIQGHQCFKILVIKPARNDLDLSFSRMNKFGLRGVITSSLDHPVGVTHAAILASFYKKTYPNLLLDPGCWTHPVYESDPFSKMIVGEGPHFPEVAGTGIGFDSLLEKSLWIEL